LRITGRCLAHRDTIGGSRVDRDYWMSRQDNALAVQLQDMDMMRHPVEHRAGQTLAAEDGCPFLNRKFDVTMVEPRS
jgi:hypothetical protein